MKTDYGIMGNCHFPDVIFDTRSVSLVFSALSSVVLLTY